MEKIAIQNIYDDPNFFSKYMNLRKNNLGFNNLIEQPAIHSLLPDLKDKAILDIGCGYGNFCQFAACQGASHIIGIDPSKNMISEAKKLNPHNNITYQCIPLELSNFKESQFDLIVSSLAIHYIEDFLSVVKKISSWLRKNCYFIFSVEHPICTAHPDSLLGKDNKNLDFHPIYNYRDEKCFTQFWLVDGVKKYHRTVSTYINTLIENNFIICSVLEPMPSDETLKSKSNFTIHKIRPPLLIIKAKISENSII